MLIFEIDQSTTGNDQHKLMSLVQFLSGRSADTTAKKEISQEAFIKLAKNLGVNVTPDNLGDLIAQPPLSNILQPLDPNSGKIVFKGGDDTAPAMSVDKARDIVDKNAKNAMKSRS